MGKNAHFCSMEQLNFKSYPFRIKNKENKRYIFDVIRKKDILLTPEEWVRQHCLYYLNQELKYPLSLINVEKEIYVHNQKKRYDIIVFYPNGEVNILVECKAPNISINQNTFDQIAQYNLTVNSSFMMVTNGLSHYFCQMDHANKKYLFLSELPVYSYLK